MKKCELTDQRVMLVSLVSLNREEDTKFETTSKTDTHTNSLLGRESLAFVLCIWPRTTVVVEGAACSRGERRDRGDHCQAPSANQNRRRRMRRKARMDGGRRIEVGW